MELYYGKRKLTLTLPPGVSGSVIQARKEDPIRDPQKALLESLRSPIASPPLQEIVSKGEKVCLLVNDATRVARSEFFLPLLIDELCEAGIKEKDIFIVFANGSHRAMSDNEMKGLVGPRVASRVAMYNHDSRDKDNLVFKGNTAFGTPVYVNKRVAEADRRILTGSVVHHFFAGFGGGRKVLIPGVAGWETIRSNHSMLLCDGARTGNLEGNPVHEDLLQAALMVGGDFLLNTLLNEQKDFLGFFAGDMIQAHESACAMAARVNGADLDHPADIVIASCGGHPKDINLYQAHKALDNALRVLRPGGRLILLAECLEGVGSTVFEEWSEKYRSCEEMEAALRKEFVLGGHKAYAVAKLLRKGTVYLLSELNPHTAARIGFIPVSTLEEAVETAFRDISNPDTCVIPQGSTVVPCCRGNSH